MLVSDGVQAFVEAIVELQMGDETRASHNFNGVLLFLLFPHDVAISYTSKANESETFKDWLVLVMPLIFFSFHSFLSDFESSLPC